MKNNKLIAEFMNLNIVTLNDIRANKNPYIGSADGYTEEELKYDTSWDWLMPVVCRIDDLFGDDDYIDNQINKVHNAVLEFDRERIHNSVVRFIRDYEIKMWQLNNGFPFMEGDDYWVIEDDGSLSTLSCWDDMSEEMHLKNPDRKYFSSEEEGLKYIKSQKK